MSNHPTSDDSNYYALAGSALAAAGLAYYMTKSDPQIDPLYDFDNQSIEIDEKEHIRINSLLKGKSLVEYRLPDVRTLYDVLPKGLEVSGNGPCLGERDGPAKGPYSWIKYSEVLERVKFIGSGLLNKGFESNNLTNIGIYSANRTEWIISEHACYTYSFAVVSLYDSYGKASINYILNHAEIKVIFVDNYERMINVLENINKCEHLKMIVHFDNYNSEQMKNLENYRDSVQIVYFKDLMKSGRENVIPAKPPKPSDTATICYTSGTTGKPKGAIISHGNIICAEAAIFENYNKPHLGINFTKVVAICYLPLAHMLARQDSLNVLICGGQIGMISGDITTLLDDVKELKPNDMPMVPRLFNRFYNGVMSKVKANPLKHLLFKRAIAAKEADRKRGIYRKNTIYDKLIFDKIRAEFGGNVNFTASGSAPISDEVMIFSKAVFSCPIPEGYGQTESTCGISFTHPLDPVLGHVGPPVVSNMVKLIDVPEMEYYSDKNKGEICIKGPNVFQGYLNDEQKTRETIDQNGWLHTGDIGMWLPNGTLKIIDRKKNLFKLSQGEYISPEKIENVYARNQFIAQIIVEGNSLKDYTVAIIVPDEVYLKEYCKAANIDGSFEELCKNKKIRQTIVNELNKLGKEEGLMSYEQIKNVHLYPVMFSLQNGLATPTLKLKRANIREFFKETVINLYAEHDSLMKSKI